MRKPVLSVLPFLALTLAACIDDTSALSPRTGGGADAGDGGPAGPTPIEELPIQETIKGAGLSGPVDIVRDTAGVPHIYAANLPDATFVEGYVMAQDRWMEMDFGRRQASGTLSEIVGGVSTAVIGGDISYRTHHMKATAEATYKALTASTDPIDQKAVAILKSFTAGVNMWIKDLRAGKYKLPEAISAFYDNRSVTDWTEVDSLVMAELQAFSLAFDAESEIRHSAFDAAEAAKFPAGNPRAGFTDDYFRFAPFEATHTVDGWKDAGNPVAAVSPSKLKKNDGKKKKGPSAASALALYDGAMKSVSGLGLDRKNDPSKGSNNWVIAPSLSATGKAMVANDTHLSLPNPAIFYLVHLSTKDGYDAMGVQFPGIPLITLGQSKKLSWGSTVNYIDVTDVYQETVSDCGADKCVSFKGSPVKLVPREESFKVGLLGQFTETKKITFYDVPHHGPIVPRQDGSGGVNPLGASELSIRYTGYEPGRLLRAVYGITTANNVDEAVKAVEDHFTHGGQNWVFADVEGNIAWTQAIRIPKRPKTSKPWKVLPGDGSAEWNGYFDPKLAPHAKNPAKGYLVTANADPLGVTDGNDPMNQPEIGGSPLYLAATAYDPGTRASRITQRITEATAGGKKLDRDAMSSIQADAITNWGKVFAPTFLDAAKALADENATPGTNPALAPLLAGTNANVKGYLATARTLVSGWTFDTPSGEAGDNPTAAQIADSQATLIMAVWVTKFANATLGDELAELGQTLDRSHGLKLMANLVKDPTKLKTGAVLFDDITTGGTTEDKAFIAAKAVVKALEWMFAHPTLGADATKWRWGQLHTTQPNFFLPASPPLSQDKIGRHGGDGTVDVASHGIGEDVGGTPRTYAYGSGAAIRFVSELDKDKGPVSRNIIPGGEIFDPTSPHYSDLYKLWAKNQAVELPFVIGDVANASKQEMEKNKLGRRRFEP